MAGGLVARPGMSCCPARNDAPGTDSIVNTRFAVVIGLDVGKSGHHACALDLDGEKLSDKPLPQDQAALRDLFTRLQDRGEVLMVERGCCGSLGPIPGAIPWRWS